MENVYFQEQIDLFLSKTEYPTKKWDDLIKSAHDHAFVVAGQVNMDILKSIKEALVKSILFGDTLDQFNKKMDSIMESEGWGYNGWRKQIIHDTNLFSTYSAGRLEQLKKITQERPLWRYMHSDTVMSPRPLHVSWHGLILPSDHNWWKTHFPPNGFGCRCYVESLPIDYLKEVRPAPEDGEYEWKGEIIPKGIDPGWNYMPGETFYGKNGG